MMTLSPAPRADEPAAGPAAAACEHDLIQATLAGNARAFDEIIRTHHRRIYHYVHQMTRQHQDAEDLTQQTFIKAFHHLARFDRQRPLINWLLRIARNTALNHFRDTKTWDEMPPETAGHEPTPAHSAERREETANLWDRARALLSAREFEILWLRFAEEMSTEETARIVGLTQTHVKVLVHRARQTLLKGAHRP
jgi:RNA polymerase sigma-70 factor (ECF subfamily)